MRDPHELTPVQPAAELKEALLNHAARRRRQIGRKIETEPELPELAPQGIPASRSFRAPAWSALHD